MKSEYSKKKSFGQHLKQNHALNKLRVALLSASITALLCTSVSSYASDAEIYVVPTKVPGKTTLMFLLDISLSMGQNFSNSACDVPSGYGVASTGSDTVTYQHNGFTTVSNRRYCIANINVYYFKRTGAGSKKDPYQYFSCGNGSTNRDDCTLTTTLTKDPLGYRSVYAGSNTWYFYQYNVKYYDRISRLKNAMIDMLIGNSDEGVTALGDSLVLGLATLGAKNKTGSMVNTGAILVPARALGAKVNGNQTQRDILVQRVAQLTAISYTPTARSYAEVAAYLLGTHTLYDAYNGNYNWTNLSRAVGSSPYSGFQYSDDDTKKYTQTDYHYIMPDSIQEQLGDSVESRHAKECSGQGIYVLTDGVPNETWPSRWLMRTALTSPTFKSDFYEGDDGWTSIHGFAKYLLDPSKNPLGIQIKTAVVGFGDEFQVKNPGSDIRRTKEWGEIGQGGSYTGNDSQDVVDSVKNFLKEITKDVPSVSTGASTIPVDALNPETIQPYSYFPQFEPKVDPNTPQQLWLGNLKKYYVVNNGVYASSTASNAQIVVKNSVLQDLSDIWAKNVTYPDKTPIFQKGGALSQLQLGNTNQRKLLTDYVYNSTTRNYVLQPIQYTYTTNSNTKSDPRAKALMALLGYNITNDTAIEDLDLSTQTADLRQMGSSPHSLPILLTQQGKLYAENTTGSVVIKSLNRKDYILFGTTQGLIQVVDAATGVEKFAFVPKEVIANQSETFRENGGTLNGGRYALYDGMDGEWAAHTEYVTTQDGTLTVNATDRSNIKGKQWVYGGMRMGGRSYYALDLTNIDNPTLKFQIDPSTGMVYSAKDPTGKAFPEIKNMAQSWSKPTLGYINWKGERKLVMLVGGGYDAGGNSGDGLWKDGKRTGFAGYEYYNYQQAQSSCSDTIKCSTDKKGAGIYMFDADSGDLLWYADGRKSNEVESTSGVVHLQMNDLNYSVVSQIKTVDRNNDGIIDHLYFGDLAGQGFRVDLKNDGNKNTYTAQVTKVLDLHKANGTSPRFYLMPTFTAHRSAGSIEGGNIVVATFMSGNKSSPLLATTDSLETTGLQNSTNLEYDGVYAVYDHDIYPNQAYYPSNNMAARTLATSTSSAISPTKLKLIETTVKSSSNVTGAAISEWGGWYYPFKTTYAQTTASPAVIKGLSPLIAMENSLYVTMYDASAEGTTSGCGAGVKGLSFAKRLCLPTGVCAQNADYTYNLGSGIISLGVGPNADGTKGIIVPDPSNAGKNGSTCVGSDCNTGKNFISAGGTLKFIPNRWYERYAKTN